MHLMAVLLRPYVVDSGCVAGRNGSLTSQFLLEEAKYHDIPRNSNLWRRHSNSDHFFLSLARHCSLVDTQRYIGVHADKLQRAVEVDLSRPIFVS